jgi:uncharacterized membrane protein
MGTAIYWAFIVIGVAVLAVGLVLALRIRRQRDHAVSSGRRLVVGLVAGAGAALVTNGVLNLTIFA